MTRQRLIDIIVTACVGALIAFLQGILAGLTSTGMPATDPALAAGFGAIIKASHGYIRAA